ncbi:hypothetical protein FOZ63_008439, partial [Perkinsus olseni]
IARFRVWSANRYTIEPMKDWVRLGGLSLVLHVAPPMPEDPTLEKQGNPPKVLCKLAEVSDSSSSSSSSSAGAAAAVAVAAIHIGFLYSTFYGLFSSVAYLFVCRHAQPEDSQGMMFSLFRRLSGLLHRPSSSSDATPGGNSERSSSRKRRIDDTGESVYSEEKVPTHCVRTLRKRTLPSAALGCGRAVSGDTTGVRRSWPSSITIK